LTYGLDREFPEKTPLKKLPPAYGPFKNGDLAHKGYNKTIGANWPYYEDPEVDTVKYHPSKTMDQRASVWRDPTHAQSTPMKTIHDNFRNAAREEPNKLLKSSSFAYGGSEVFR
jgi:hypothetical protein